MPRVLPNLILAFVNLGIVIGLVLGYRNYRDKLSLFAIGGVCLLVLNGMVFAIRRTEPQLPHERFKRLNKWVVWPIILLAGMLFLLGLLAARR